jgi:hypothetical protein
MISHRTARRAPATKKSQPPTESHVSTRETNYHDSKTMIRVRMIGHAPDLYQLAEDLAAGVVSLPTLRKRAHGILFEIVTGQRCSAAHACDPTTTGAKT